MVMKLNRKIILLFPLIAGIFWGSGGIFVRTLKEYGMNSVTIFSTRILLECIILFIGLLIFKRESFKIKLKDLWLFIGCGVIGVLLLNLCYNEAMFNLTLSLAAVLLSLSPIFVMLLSAIIFKEKITMKKIFCLILAILGCVLVSGILESTSITWNLKGLIFGILAGFFWAVYGIFSKLATEKGYSTYTVVFYSVLFMSIALLPFTDFGKFGYFINADPIMNIPFALAHTLFTALLPYLLFTIGLTYIDNGKATLLCSSSEPVAATLFGSLLFYERPTIFNLIGVALAILALTILIRNEEEVEK